MDTQTIDPGTLDSTIIRLLEQPSAWGAIILFALFLYFWRKDVSNPQRSASSAVLSGAVDNAVSVYAMAKEALDEGRECRRQNRIMFEHIRELQQALTNAGLPVPKMPEELWNS